MAFGNLQLYYIIKNSDNSVIAITEFKDDICQFFIQNNYTFNKYSIFKCDKQKKCSKMLAKYHELYLLEYRDFIIRNIDYQALTDIIEDTRKKMKSSIKDLEYIKDISNLSKKENKAFDTVIDVLKKNKKKKNIEYFIQLDSFIKEYYNIPSLQEQILRLNNDFEFHILED